MGCFVCGELCITKAHVKDRSQCLKDGNSNHTLYNILDLCYNCHYILFDKRKMGILKKAEDHYFVILRDGNQIEEVKSKYSLNVLDEYITWKNLRCTPILLKYIFKRNKETF